MAQSTAGIKLYFADITGTPPTSGAPEGSSTTATWTEIPDVTTIPAMGGEPNMLDSTVIAETKMKRYIPGLKDGGGAMSYGVLMTPAMLTATDSASAAIDAGDFRAFKVVFPAPLSCYYWYVGTGIEVTPGEAEVDGVLSSTFYTSIESSPVKVAITG